jgi:adenylate cyclase
VKDPVVHEALRQIQDIVTQETGAPLAARASTRVEKVLTSALGQLAGTWKHGGNLTHEVTILLADLRGFTSLSAAHPAGLVLDLLNRCFVRMSEIIFRHHGGIDKFMGDSILVIFESAEGQTEDSVRRAVSCAVDMQNAMEELNKLHRKEGLPDMFFGIGINTGRVMSAFLGSDLYSEYTVIGDEVNLASRIESFSLRGQVLISESTWQRCDGFVKTGEPMEIFVKGKSKPVVLREVLGIPALAKTVPRQEVRRSPRVDVLLPIEYQVIANEVVVPEAHHGRILDIGYHGVLAEVPKALPTFTELRMSFELPLIGKRVTDLYGKVVKTARSGKSIRAGIEFSSMDSATRASIQVFVQLLVQGSESRD